MTDEGLICRICRTGNEQNHPVMKPCECRGTMQHVHEDCLIDWLAYTRRKQCEICKFDYNLRVSYTPNCSNILVGCFSLLELPHRCLKFLFNYLLTMLSFSMWFIAPSIVIRFIELCCNRDFVDKSSGLGAMITEAEVGTPILGFLHLLIFYSFFVSIKSTTGSKRHKLERIFRAISSFGIRNWKYMAPVSGILGIVAIVVFGYVPFYIGHYLSSKVIPTEFTESNLELQVLPKIVLGESLILLSVYVLQRVFNLLPWNLVPTTMAFVHRMSKAIFIVLLQYCLLPMLCGFWFNICLAPNFKENLNNLMKWNNEEPFDSMLVHYLVGVFYIYCLTIVKNEVKHTLHPKMNKLLLYSNIKIWFSMNLNSMPFWEYIVMILYIVMATGVVMMLQFLIPIQILRTGGIFNLEWYQTDFQLRFAIWVLLYINDLKIIFKGWCYYLFPRVGLQDYLIPIEQLRIFRHNQPQFALEIQIAALRLRLPVPAQGEPDDYDLPPHGVFFLFPRCCALAVLSLISAIGVTFLLILIDSCLCILLVLVANNIANLMLTASCVGLLYYICAPSGEPLKYFLNIITKTSVILYGHLCTMLMYKSLLFASYLYIFGYLPAVSEFTMAILIMSDLLIIPFIIYGPKTRLQQAINHIKEVGLEDVPVKFILTELFSPFLKHVGFIVSIPVILVEFFIPNLINNFYLELHLGYYIYLVNFVIQNFPVINFYIKCLIDQFMIYYNRIKLEYFSREIHLAEYDEVTIEGNSEDQHILPLKVLPEQVLNKLLMP
ncbi:probable E3 ubiquitin ligase SUD1 [Teleopsis dalmanni]|uniref:probable E3 ubiquitin ligase SUD1 n=1 Tax=Teleopsis dalmanni TaxID=139649 RepID=UPI0018CE738D|nr:probable E3 ubiquitin ligase SUD1 [Teleopsis dalmanni]